MHPRASPPVLSRLLLAVLLLAATEVGPVAMAAEPILDTEAVPAATVALELVDMVLLAEDTVAEPPEASGDTAATMAHPA